MYLFVGADHYQTIMPPLAQSVSKSIVYSCINSLDPIQAMTLFNHLYVVRCFLVDSQELSFVIH